MHQNHKSNPKNNTKTMQRNWKTVSLREKKSQSTSDTMLQDVTHYIEHQIIFETYLTYL